MRLTAKSNQPYDDARICADVRSNLPVGSSWPDCLKTTPRPNLTHLKPTTLLRRNTTLTKDTSLHAKYVRNVNFPIPTLFENANLTQ